MEQNSVGKVCILHALNWQSISSCLTNPYLSQRV